MRTNTTLKTKAMSLLLAIVVLLGMLPISVFAADESTVTTITNDNVNDESEYYYDNDYSETSVTLELKNSVKCAFAVDQYGNTLALNGLHVVPGTTVIEGGVLLDSLTNRGTISGGSFDPDDSGGLSVENRDAGVISGGTFNGNNTYSLTVENEASISGGTFYGTVTNTGTISNGTFNGLVTNYGTITGGTFSKGILNMGGTIADGVNATVAQGGDLAIVKQNLGTGSITVKQNGIDIPSGKAGETYNVAASGGTLVGLYLLTGDETVPTENYAIESDFRAVLGGLGGYDFTMPNEAVTIVAVFDGYVPTEISIWPYIVEGTDEESLEAAEWIDYEIAPLTSFTENTVLPGDAVPGFITVGGERYDFAGFIMSEYDEATDTVSYSLVETLTISAEPAQGTDEWYDWYTPISDGLMAAYMLHTHSYAPTYDNVNHWDECSCGDKQNEAKHTYSSDTDTTCDCGYNRGLFEVGTVDKDFVDVGFIPGDGVTLPDDAELVVEDHYPSLAPIASTIVPTAETEYVDIPENNISRLEDIVGGYKRGEIDVIDGEKHMVFGGADVYVHLIRLSDKAKFTYSLQWSTLAPSSMPYDVEIQTNRTIIINGAKYDVPATMTHNGIEQYAVLYVDGVLAGLYIPSNNEASFYEGYHPETLKAQQDDNDLGSVTIPADYNNAAIADFAPGKTYKVSVIGSNDISVEGLTEVNGTVTQTFKIPDALVGAKTVQYVAVHDTNPYAADLAEAERRMKALPNDETRKRHYETVKALYDGWEEENDSGAEFGTVTVSDDGKIVTVTYAAVDSFSPFIVYAFVEADEPVYKELSATLHTEHTYEKGKCTVCEAVDPDYVPEGSSPQTGDNSHMALWIALLFISGGAVISLTVVDRKRGNVNR